MAAQTDNTARALDYVTASTPKIDVSVEETLDKGPVVAPFPKPEKDQGLTSEAELQVDPSSIKLLSRSVAELTNEDEYERFLEQKRILLRKKYTEGVSKKEDLALQLIIWNIDRIEDAKYGKNLDALETIVKAHEVAAAKISHTVDNFERLISSSRQSRSDRARR